MYICVKLSPRDLNLLGLLMLWLKVVELEYNFTSITRSKKQREREKSIKTEIGKNDNN